MHKLGYRCAIHFAVKGRRQLRLHGSQQSTLCLLAYSLIDCLLSLEVLLQLGNFFLHLCKQLLQLLHSDRGVGSHTAYTGQRQKGVTLSKLRAITQRSTQHTELKQQLPKPNVRFYYSLYANILNLMSSWYVDVPPSQWWPPGYIYVRLGP